MVPSRIFAIFDIHGRSDLLKSLMNKLLIEKGLNLSSEDKLIFMGDYIDRGPDSKGVVEIVKSFKETYPKNVVALKGNHEDMMIAALSDFEYFELWVDRCNGGNATTYSYGGKIPQEHVDFLKSLPLSHREHGFFFSHAPLPKEHRRMPKDQGQPFTDDELMWGYPGGNEKDNNHSFSPEADGTPVVGVCGHVVKLSHGGHLPRLYPDYIYGDAGCGKYDKAPLCAIEVKTREIVFAYPPGSAGYAEETEQARIEKVLADFDQESLNKGGPDKLT